MTYIPSGDHLRNLAKSEYEALHREGNWYFVGNTEKTAIKRAAELAGDVGERVRLYRTYPTPGPTRRYVGLVEPDGKFLDWRR